MGGGSRKSEMKNVVEAFRHPSYNSSDILSSLPYDVALLKLETPSQIKPARLAAADGSDSKPGTMATSLGWGKGYNDIQGNDILQTMDVEILTDAKCAELNAELAGITLADFVQSEISPTHIDQSAEISVAENANPIMCLGTGNGRDYCSVDSGSPILVNDVLVGIVSAGSNICGELPRLRAQVSNTLDFINDILNGGSTGNVTEMLTAWSGTLFDTITSQDGSD
ncbi:Hypothetical protein PHPALM_20131 [Phytophthora palmivora]|uniref:Peptidase S1 domain-containing protein n=1 Tax=Phytophthora palmivora TaxID=4796 RepID=A0A2P4XFM8_9STRA|nr:Hypothetical protein PHPALM_20131 [Phytophthora palmivora]